MKVNIGELDRYIRIAVGLSLLALVVALDSGARWFGLLGIVPLATGVMRWCPLYTLLGLNTCPVVRPLESLPADTHH